MPMIDGLMQFHKPMNIDDTYFVQRRGQYSLVQKEFLDLEWIACRERLQKLLDPDNKGLFFGIGEEYPEKIVDFINDLERCLCVHIDELSNFQRTCNKSVLYVAPSRFWMDDPLKRNLFSLLLRVVLNCSEPVSPSKAFLLDKYTSLTMPALDRFFAGFTRYVGDQVFVAPHNYGYISTGWFSIFRLKSAKEVANLLVD